MKLIFLGTLLLSFFGCTTSKQMNIPILNDVTTDPYSPPKFIKIAKLEANQGRNMSYPQKNIDIQQVHYADILPIKSKLSATQTFEQCRKVGLSMPRWTLVDEDKKRLILEFTATSGLMRYKDDIIIQVTSERTGSTLHMRSKSRIGKSDLGTNAKRIREFFQKFRESY